MHAWRAHHLIVQVSNDVRMLLPILVGILAAKWVADAATHSLYHGLLEVLLSQIESHSANKTDRVTEICLLTLLTLTLLCAGPCAASAWTLFSTRSQHGEGQAHMVGMRAHS